MTVSEDGTPWVVGEEFEYEVTKDERDGGNKIKRVTSGGAFGGGGARYKKNEKLESAS